MIFEEMSILVLYIVLSLAWFYILMHSVIQYRNLKNSPLLIRSIYLIIALFAFRFFSVYAIYSLNAALNQALLGEELVALIPSFYDAMTFDIIDSIDTIVTFAIFIIIMLGLFGRQRIQLQNELNQFIRLKFDAERMHEIAHRQSSYIALLESASTIKKMLSESSTKDEILNNLCKMLGNVSHYKVVWIGLQREESTVIDIAYRADLSNPSYLTKEFYVNLDDEDPHSHGPVGECMRTGRSVLIDDTQSDPRFEPWKRSAKISGIHSVLSIPMQIFNQDKLFGVISIYGDAEHTFSYAEINILEDLVRNVSSAIAYHEADNRRKATEHELENSSELLQNIISTVPVRIFWKDTELRYLGCNKLFLHDAGIIHLKDIIGKKDTELVWEEHAAEYNLDDLQVMHTKLPVVNRVERLGEMWVLTNKAPFFDNERNVIGMIGSYTDITLQHRAELYLKESEQRFRELMDSLPNISIQGYDKERKVIYWNQQSEVLYGYSESEALGRRLEELIIPDERRDEVVAAIDNWIINRVPVLASEETLRKKDGSEVLVYSSHVLLQSKENEPEIYSIDIDLTQRKEAEKALEHLANYDILTELPNRLFFLRHVKALINKSERQHTEFALFFMDLDDFKEINDTYGHEYGDYILIETGKRLRTILRDYDFVARYGGDEFIVTIEYEGDTDFIATIADKIVSRIQEPFVIEEVGLQIGSSIGISLYPHDTTDLQTLLKYADQAMYRAKERGKNQFDYYSK